MSRFNSNLDHVRVAAPCSADWDSMFGDDRVRFCGQCKLNVYNLSEMRRAEAELLVGRAEGRVCVRYFQRRDGSIITDNCPVGLRAIKRRLTRVANAIGSMIISFSAGIGTYVIADRLQPQVIQGEIRVKRSVSPPPLVRIQKKREVMMGGLVMPVIVRPTRGYGSN